MNQHSRHIHALGFSIIEFMIAISLGGLIIATAASVYSNNKSTFRAQEQIARLQENGRYAEYYLGYTLRMAGYQGCGSNSQLTVNNLIDSPSTFENFSKSLNGYDGASGSFSPSLSSNLSGKAIAGSDVIEVRMAQNSGVQLRTNMASNTSSIPVYDRKGINSGDPLIISNCIVADLFIAGGSSNASSITHSSSSNTSSSLSTAYPIDAHIFRYTYYAFYIKDTGRKNSQNQPIYALIRQNINGVEEELVEGVEKMHIQYAVDTNSDKGTDSYQTAAQINSGNHWNNVVGVKINLLMTTNENVVTQSQTYTFDGITYTPSDQKLRREWPSFINIRNRGMPS